MKEPVDKKIEGLVGKIMKDSTLESPSLNFTAHVMSQVKNLETNSITSYKPLISKRILLFLGLSLVGLCLFLAFNNPVTDSGWFGALDFSVLTQNKFIDILPSINMSKTVVYSVVLFGIMFFIQIPLLKGYLDKSIKV